MDWSEERYVRLYVRDTVGWKLLPWQSKALLPLLLRKAYPLGWVDTEGRGAAGLAVIVELPVEVVEPGLAGLVADGCVVVEGERVVVRNYEVAQHTRSSDRVRQQFRRDRNRGDESSPGVTRRGKASPRVTTRTTEQSIAEQSRDPGSVSGGTPPTAAPSPADAGPPPATAVQLQEAWNAHQPALPAWREWTPARGKAARLRLKERPIEAWREVIARIAASAFCRGENDRGWRADPDWLLRPGTAARVLEGKYDDRQGRAGARDVRKGHVRAEDMNPEGWEQEGPHGTDAF